MSPFDPAQNRETCEEYLTEAFGAPAKLIAVEPLEKSTREGPCRLEIEISGDVKNFVLRFDAKRGQHEYESLRAMESIPIPTPRTLGWNPDGDALGSPCYLIEFIDGQSLLKPMLDGEPWAADLYIETVRRLQDISRDQLQAAGFPRKEDMTAQSVLHTAHLSLEPKSDSLLTTVYDQLTCNQPPVPKARFSNGDLYPDNLLIQNRRLAAVIDWEMAGFSDPIYEFLLPFFVCPQLRNRGIEERYFLQMQFDPAWLHWYHGLEYFDTLHWVEKTGKPFVHYTIEVLRDELEAWLRNSQ